MVSFTSDISQSRENAAKGYSPPGMEKQSIPLVIDHQRRATRSAFFPHPDLTPSPGLRRPDIARTSPTRGNYRACLCRSRTRNGSSQGSTRPARRHSELPLRCFRLQVLWMRIERTDVKSVRSVFKLVPSASSITRCSPVIQLERIDSGDSDEEDESARNGHLHPNVLRTEAEHVLEHRQHFSIGPRGSERRPQRPLLIRWVHRPVYRASERPDSDPLPPGTPREHERSC